MPTARVPCNNTANIRERKIWTQKWILHLAEFREGARTPKNVYIVYQPRRRRNIVQSLVDCHCATSVMKPRRETCWNLLGCTKLPNRSKPLVGRKFTILWGHVDDVGEILLFNNFFAIDDRCFSCEDIARQSSAMVSRWRIFVFFCALYFQRAACSIFQKHTLDGVKIQISFVFSVCLSPISCWWTLKFFT